MGNLSSTRTADTRNSECMWMLNAGFSELPPMKDFIKEGSTAYQYQYTLFYPSRTFLKGKLQPLMRNGSMTYLLQSHPTLNATFPPHRIYSWAKRHDSGRASQHLRLDRTHHSARR